jgi:hypothetical protein
MAIGACGIACDACQLMLRGICSTCGPGGSPEAERKIAAQKRILGAPCPILACARQRGIAHCLRDCAAFPCESFKAGPYPFAAGFLAMQARRRGQNPAAWAPDGSRLKVAEAHWRRLDGLDLELVCNRTLFERTAEGGLAFRFLNEEVRLDIAGRRLLRLERGAWQACDDPLLELAAVLYIGGVRDIYPLGREIVGAKDLKEGHFFQGPHALKTAPLLARFGADPQGFRRAAERLGGEPVPMADHAFRLKPFPRVPLYYLLWTADAEFPARMSVLFDRSIEECLAADAIWGLVNRVSDALLR